MANKNIERLRQTLAAAESSLKLAKQLVNDLEKPSAPSVERSKVDDTPGIVGIFDGENMTSSDGQTFPVPSNYASKSMLVVGDTLKLTEEGKEKRFKQIDHVKRYKTTGVLTKKDGKWAVITPEGSYKVSPAAVSHFGAEVGNEIILQIPEGNKTVGWGAIETVKKEVNSASETEVVKEPVESKPAAVTAPVIEEKPQVKKPVAVKKEEKKTEEKIEVPAEVVVTPAAAVSTPKPELAKPAPAVVSVAKPAVEKPMPEPVVSPASAPVASEPAAPASAPVSSEDELT